MKRDKYTAVLGNAVVYHDMSTLTEKRPLANLPFDGKYRLIDFQLSNLANAGIHNIYAIFRGHNIHSVFDHVRSGREWGLNTLLSHYFLGFYEEQHSSELANRDYYEQILTYLKRSGSEQTVYMNCDILCNIDLAQVIHLHEVSDGNITVVYKKMPKEAISDANEILDIDETDHVIGRTTIDDNLELQKMSADIYVAKTPWLINRLEEEMKREEPRRLLYFLRELLLTSNALAFEYTGYLSNIFSVKSYYDANMDMLNAQKFYSLLYTNHKVYTRVKNEEASYFSNESQVTNAQFASGSIVKGRVEHSIVSRNCYLSKDSQVTGSILFPKVTVGEGAVVENAIVDKNVIVHPGVVIRGTKENPLVIKKGLEITEDIIE